MIDKAKSKVFCNQKDCEIPGMFRFTWPGADERVICLAHLPQLLAVADALGLHLQIRPVVEEVWDGLDGPCCE